MSGQDAFSTLPALKPGTSRPALVIALALVTVLAACGKPAPTEQVREPRPVELIAVGTSGASELRVFAGQVETTNISALAFEVPGRVVQIAVLDGARVREGQLLARIDDEPYRLQVQRAEAQYNQLAEDLKRKAVLRDENILSGAGYDQLKAAADIARAQRDLARRDLRNTRLVAPFDGRIARRTIETQQMVQAGAPVFTLEATSRLEVGVALPQNVAESLPFDRTLQARAWPPDRPSTVFPLVYREHSTLATPAGSVYRLLFSLARPEQLTLLPGMALRVSIDVPGSPAAQSALIVPVNALTVAADGSRAVWKYDAATHRVHRTAVALREIRQNDAVVSGALQAGDQVVAAGAQFVSEGEAVRPLEANP
ncbi:RND family efflux transporter MFP subunit [Paraburkholderia unamae]|uniref:efflux RND transporter periplasmic adaptor subunit n=1 Tax=Paraburkholderia unamae TaxID=219649 RepID=UPI000DC1F8E0|nr:efflux RND transporter periplasmic adaptor subunit [Paraburkholderia unamae]RAR53601.1 RND family efflux transporter MFP subunit [Paraburkholderia unamae]